MSDNHSFFEEDCMDPMNMPLHVLFQQVIHMQMQYMCRLMQPMDIKPGQAAILFVLLKKGAVSQRELANIIQIKPPSITAALQKLEKRGLIERKMDERDQRILRIQISEKGHECLKSMKTIENTVKIQLYKGMSQEEMLLFRRVMIQMRENMLEVEKYESPEILEN